MLQSIKKTANGLVALFKDGTSFNPWLGRTNGLAVPSGYIGETITGSMTDPGTITGSLGSDIAMTGSIVVPAGRFTVTFGGHIRHEGNHNSTGDYEQGSQCHIKLYNGSSDVSTISAINIFPYTPSISGSQTYQEKTYEHNSSTAITYSLRRTCSKDGAVTLAFMSITGVNLRAVRIA